MPNLFPIMQPGVSIARTTGNRIIFRQRNEHYLAQGLSIDGTKSRDPGNTPDIGVLRAGLLMGRLTSGGKLAPSVIGVTTNAEAAGSVAIEAAAAVVTELVRRQGASGTFKLTGPPTANGVVATETVTYSAASGTSITVTALANAFVAGSFIQPTDGSETPLTFIDDLTYGGIQVTDDTGTSVASVDFPRVPIDGEVDSSQILPAWPSDTSLQNWIMSRLNDISGCQFGWDHRFVG